MVLIIAAIGVSGSGKTVTLEYLISQLSAQGYRIGAIKHIHRENFTIDREGSNTWRFSKAGSKVTVAVSPEEIAIIQKTNTGFNDLDKIIKQLEGQIDILFIEGFKETVLKRENILKIITAKAADDLKLMLKEAVPPILAITGIIAKSKPSSDTIPFIDLPDEGQQLVALIKKNLGGKVKGE
jgi:molybdopterin-guanine dinucleotide biosynthesis protein MobB